MTFFRQVPILTPSAESSRESPESRNSPPQHITLLGVLDDQYQLIDTVNLVFDTLNERTKGIGNVIDQGVRDPVGSDGNIIFELFDTSSHVLGVRGASKVELHR